MIIRVRIEKMLVRFFWKIVGQNFLTFIVFDFIYFRFICRTYISIYFKYVKGIKIIICFNTLPSSNSKKNDEKLTLRDSTEIL